MSLNLSFGSNCEMGMMINRYYNNNIHSNLFNWTNIKLDKLYILLNNWHYLENINNIKFIYKIFLDNACIFSTDKIEEINKFYLNDIKNYVIHLDYEFYIDCQFIFWSHGINIDIDEIINYNATIVRNHNLTIISKYNHLIKNTLNILSNDTDVIKIYLKALQNEYTSELFIKLHDLIVKNNIYLGIIYECDNSDNDINLELKNTIFVKANKLTNHNEAIYSELYNTEPVYFNLFDQLDKIVK